MTGPRGGTTDHRKGSGGYDRTPKPCEQCQGPVGPVAPRGVIPKFCKPCKKQRDRESQKRTRNPETVRRYRLARYGLTPEDYDAILQAQHGGCALCERTTATRTGKPLHVDHNHRTGEVRGLLCDYCNRKRLGRGREDSAMHLKIADYLDNGAARVRALLRGG